MYVKVSNGTITEYPYSVGQLIADNPNTSFPENPSPALLEEWGVFPVTPVPLNIVDTNKRITEGTPVFDNGWKQTWIIEDLDQAEIDSKNQQLADDTRQHRNQLLAACDWTQLPDAIQDPVKKQLWADYRQSLRDITDQANFPHSIVWPISPEPVNPILPMHPFRYRYY